MYYDSNFVCVFSFLTIVLYVLRSLLGSTPAYREVVRSPLNYIEQSLVKLIVAQMVKKISASDIT
jgi:hypothetical protein